MHLCSLIPVFAIHQAYHMGAGNGPYSWLQVLWQYLMALNYCQESIAITSLQVNLDFPDVTYTQQDFQDRNYNYYV